MITIRPETQGNTLVIEASNKLTTKDYEEIFMPKLNEFIGKFGKIRVVFYLDDSFDGWELGAIWDDAKIGLKHKNNFERIALVGGPRWMYWITKLSSLFIHAELKVFGSAFLEEAISWTKR